MYMQYTIEEETKFYEDLISIAEALTPSITTSELILRIARRFGSWNALGNIYDQCTSTAHSKLLLHDLTVGGTNQNCEFISDGFSNDHNSISKKNSMSLEESIFFSENIYEYYINEIRKNTHFVTEKALSSNYSSSFRRMIIEMSSTMVQLMELGSENPQFPNHWDCKVISKDSQSNNLPSLAFYCCNEVCDITRRSQIIQITLFPGDFIVNAFIQAANLPIISERISKRQAKFDTTGNLDVNEFNNILYDICQFTCDVLCQEIYSSSLTSSCLCNKNSIKEFKICEIHHIYIFHNLLNSQRSLGAFGKLSSQVSSYQGNENDFIILNDKTSKKKLKNDEYDFNQFSDFPLPIKECQFMHTYGYELTTMIISMLNAERSIQVFSCVNKADSINIIETSLTELQRIGLLFK